MYYKLRLSTGQAELRMMNYLNNSPTSLNNRLIFKENSQICMTKKLFECSKCGAQSLKWLGRCLECGAWGSLVEQSTKTLKHPSHSTGHSKNTKTIHFDEKKLIDFNKLESLKTPRFKINLNEIDQVFGGGIVPGSLTLLGGEPGIGKSTLILQIFKQLENLNQTLLYISGEESAQQIKLRIERLKYPTKNLKFLAETNLEEILAALIKTKPRLAVIDSIQTILSSEINSEAGNVAQIRGCTAKILEVAKEHNIAIILIGHITKDGSVAGPKTLEHLVDTVLYLEGDKFHDYRILRSIKNRFGSTNEIGILEMTSQGLIEVKNPALAFMPDQQQNLDGSTISCFAEGSRVFLTEIQALVSTTLFGYPQRKTAGYDLNRLQMLTAVLTKRAQLNLNNQDIHLNIIGGFKIQEPAIDLAVALAIFSALKNLPIDRKTLICGEVGLGGEIRTVHNLEKRLNEAEKLGLTTAIIPDIKLKQNFNIKIIKVKNLLEAIKHTSRQL